MKGAWISMPVALALALASSCSTVHQSNAQSDYEQGRLDDAAAEVQSALVSSPDNLPLKHLAAQIFTARGLKYYQNGEMLAGEADFHRAADYDQFYAPAWDYLGLIAFQQHRWAEAIDHGHKAAELSGQPVPVYVKQAEQQLVQVQTGGLGRPHHGTSHSHATSGGGQY